MWSRGAPRASSRDPKGALAHMPPHCFPIRITLDRLLGAAPFAPASNRAERPAWVHAWEGPTGRADPAMKSRGYPFCPWTSAAGKLRRGTGC